MAKISCCGCAWGGLKLDDGAWRFGFWSVVNDGAWSTMVVLDDGGLIVEIVGLVCVWEDFREKRGFWRESLMIFEGFDDFWGFDSFYSLFDQWVKGEFDDGAWWSRFWFVDDDGAWSVVVVLDDGGLIVDGGLGCV